ncbi:MAG: hypothetical protein ABEI96_07210 [Haloarculaceae archaeon]
MTREKLLEASECLESAADAASDDATRERLQDIAGQVATRAESERGPDHGRMARWQSALDEVLADADDTVADDVEAAKSLISDYRQGVAGV